MLICGAAAGMSAVFRAPLTGIVFALEMPYRDDLVPSLVASVVSFATLSSFLGAAFQLHQLYRICPPRSLLERASRLDRWPDCHGVCDCFSTRPQFFVMWTLAHWLKLAVGGLLTGLCGLLFWPVYPGNLLPIGPNYEAVGEILGKYHSTPQLILFSVLKLAATLFTLATSGVMPCSSRCF